MDVYLLSLCAINLLLLISSTAILYLASFLINFYLLPSLNLVTSNFATVPYLILAIGITLLVFSIIGMVAAASKSRLALVIYCVLLGVVFILQLASVFTSLELRNDMMARILNTAPQEIFLEMEQYWVDDSVRYKWDTLQRDFQCCGAIQHSTGYKDWQRVNNWGNIRSTHGVPDSCCLREQPDCGVGTGDGIFQDLYPGHSIYTHGCMTILEHRLERDIEPVLLTYIGCGVVLALVEILALVLAAAYVASITRKMRDDPGDGMGNQYEEHIKTKLMTNSQTLDSGMGSSTPIMGQSTPVMGRSTPVMGRSTPVMGRSTPVLGRSTPVMGSSTPVSVRQFEDAVHRSSLYIEPTNETGTNI